MPDGMLVVTIWALGLYGVGMGVWLFWPTQRERARQRALRSYRRQQRDREPWRR